MAYNIDTAQIWCESCEQFVDDYFEMAGENEDDKAIVKQRQTNYINFQHKLRASIGGVVSEELKQEVSRISVCESVFGL